MAMQKMILDLQKVLPVEDEDGMLTPYGMQVAEAYAREWVVEGLQNFELEERFPELEGFFQDIRTDHELAYTHAQPLNRS